MSAHLPSRLIAKPSRAPLVVIGIGGLVDQPLDLEDRSNKEGREHEKHCNSWEHPFLDGGVHPALSQQFVSEFQLLRPRSQ